MKGKWMAAIFFFLGAFLLLTFSPSQAQPIENELYLITPVSKDVHDPALKAFADYAKRKWNIDVKTSASPKGTPVAYGQILEWKGKPQADIFWGGEGTLFDALAVEGLLEPVKISKAMWDEIPITIGKPVGLPLKDPKGFWVGTTLEPYGLIYQPKLLKRLGVEIKDWDDLLNPKLKETGRTGRNGRGRHPGLPPPENGP